MEYTQEPWDFHIHGDREPTDFLIYQGDWNGTLEMIAMTSDYSVRDDANARRIVACVNACAGISTEDLESYLTGIDTQWGDAMAVVKVEGTDASGGWRGLQYERES